MELFLLKFAAFVRIVSSFDVAAALFEIAGVALFGVFVGAFLVTGALRKTLVFSAVDLAIMGFTVWCLAISLIYVDDAHVNFIAKLLIPFLTYTAAKNVVANERHYLGLLRWIVVGFAVAIVFSTALIATGRGLDYVTYWTGIPRWQGAYTGAHTFGHSMTLFLMVAGLYLHLKKLTAGAISNLEKALFAGLIALALYCLYMSQVRTAMLGLAVYAGVSLYFINKRLLFFGVAALIAVAATTVSHWLPTLFPDVISILQGRMDESNIASGRFTYWLHNLNIFADLSIDRKLAGVGIGNRAQSMYVDDETVVDSHNDWLDILMQTGIIGFLIFAAIQLLIFRAILRLPREDRSYFIALFGAANVMMFVSDSYVWRVQIGNLYYLVLAYVELPKGRWVALRSEHVATSPVFREARAYGRTRRDVGSMDLEGKG